MSIERLLVANRGEIAVRILRAAAELGIPTLAIHSEDDARALHVSRADRAAALGRKGAAAYLDMARVIALAREHGCDAVHPGYGFLSEQAEFARACEKAGIAFIGPRPETLELLGDKTRALSLAREAGVPVVQGTEGAVDAAGARATCFIDPAGVLRAATLYPANVGRSVEEMLRMRAGTAPRNFENPPEGTYLIYSNPDWKPVDVLGLLEDPWVEPGSFSYSNLNSVLLGLVAEHHGGQDLNALYRDTLFEPLGITIGLTPRDVVPLDTARAYSDDLGLWGQHYGLDLNGFGDRIEAEIAAGWEDNPTDWHIGQGKITWAAAGGFSTAENMARWAYELFSPNGSAISESNRALLLNSFGTELVDMEGRMQYYGYQATKSDVILEDGTVVTAYGHPGGAVDWKGTEISKLAYSPELDLSVSVLTNSPLSGHGACPDHSADESQRFGPQLCVIQEILKAYASSAQGAE